MAGKDGQLLIPDDWDGENWFGLCVQWPDSEKWRHVLRGLLSHLKRGRAWDGKTGSVLDAIDIGYEIFDRSFPFVPCGDGECPDCPDCPKEEKTNCGGGLIVIEDDSEMGQVVTDCKVIDGKLRVFFGPCCWFDYALSDESGSQSEEGGEDVTDPDLDTPWQPDVAGDDVACKKAAAIARAMREVHDEIEKAYASVTGLPFAANTIKRALPEYSLGLGDLVLAISMYGTVVLASQSLSLVLDDPDNIEKRLAAHLKAVVKPVYGMGKADYLATFAAVMAFGIAYELDLDVEGATVGLYWSYIFSSLGRGTLDEISKSARYLDAAEYDCEAPEDAYQDEWTEPDGGGWYLSAPTPIPYIVTFTQGYTAKAIIELTPPHDVFGAVWDETMTGGMSGVKACSIWTGLRNWSPDTSQERSGSRTRVVIGPASVWNLIYGVGSYYPLGSLNLSSSDPTTPSVNGVAKVLQGLGAELNGNGLGSLTVAKLRLLHNKNSPSHQA